MKYTPLVVFLFLFLPRPIQTASVYEEDTALVVLSHEGLRKLILPEELRSASSLTLVVHPRASGLGWETSVQEGAGSGGLRPTVSSLLYRANQLFHKKKFSEAMSLVESAEAMEPNNAKIKTMKGSLFLMMGYKEFAIEAWEESLKLDTNQPDLKMQLEKLKMEVGKAGITGTEPLKKLPLSPSQSETKP